MFMKRLILIDGNAILHRAFHALPPLNGRNGELVNAVYGFFSMFLRIIDEFKPDYIIVCFDRPKPTFRKQLYVGYQAKRPKMSDDLVPQIKIVHEILEAGNVCTFEVDGYEADDLIGTIATQAVGALAAHKNFLVHSAKKDKGLNSNSKSASVHSENFVSSPRPISSAKDTSDGGRLSLRSHDSSEVEVIIVSGDRDMLQLVNSHVKVAMPIIGITKMTIFSSTEVEEKYGIEPSQIVDYKSLAGDASDNYSGVAGVGPKTASLLLREYGTLEEIYKNLDKIKNKNPNLSIKLAEGIESAGLAKKLAEIVTDAPISIDLERCRIETFNKTEMQKEFEKFGFKSLAKRLQGKEKAKENLEEANRQLGLL